MVRGIVPPHHPLSTLGQHVGIAASAGTKEQVADVACLEAEAQLGRKHLATYYVAALTLEDRA